MGENFSDCCCKSIWISKVLVEFITSSPVVVAVFEGANAVAAARETMGATNPAEAAAGTIRGQLGLDVGRNLVHGSDGVVRSHKRDHMDTGYQSVFGAVRVARTG